ncbi:hypothetical protein EMUCRT_0124 [Ehrlichia cf. muris str. EmCRT]|uniref:Uncharacterized protein n=1 Tax=Ehrlichia cf. muris str. EmCRT TaxID=1359167 RepID=A0A0F3NDZ9_9RICK|nr:hypothetical protein EMUCRT_0124 [Ehrlichia cf. muris str. EmCRT]
MKMLLNSFIILYLLTYSVIQKSDFFHCGFMHSNKILKT